jgi:hypothetical protein
MDKRLLVFDCHEAWVHQLRALPQPLDIVIGLRGRPTAGWDESIRPVPPNARLVRLEEAVRAAESYDCIIGHNLTDLLDAKALRGPRLLILHETLDGAMLEQGSTIPADELRRAVMQFTRLTSTHVAAVSKLKGKSWGFDEDIVTLSADTEDYPAWRGELARGLRVANHIERRPRVLMWDFHNQAFGGLPITLVGHNPGMDGVKPSADWEDLKSIFSRHRFYIHTADPHLEDGYNMATLEAMAAGLPVLGNRHPTSPVENGVNGFLSDDPAELGRYAAQLLQDKELAARMGAAARETVAQRFSPSRFAAAVAQSIQSARRKWKRGRANAMSCR